MNKIELMVVVILTGFARFALAGTKAHQEPGILFWILASIVAPVVIYTGNKWRLWLLGFRFGMASKSTFLGSIKWTVASLIVTVTSILILGLFG
ncbi:hypothetical protein [Pseudomonas gingeri]|uniref:Uncharacterized protein n=1 Tax=Pseudomonas gingeri TaxID=117681 RepID=A0A7Y7WRL9_9PSED|nr:hypothetical protein [Pseudomonas gingeri]NWB86318.1 hypothetical protein [Pseudomonas gingeri]